MTIGDRLDKAMKAAKITSQKELENKSGVPQATISRILGGEGKRGPETATLVKLAAACNVSFNWLHEGIGDQSRMSFDNALQYLTPTPDVSDQDPTIDEILELINAFRESDAAARKSILKSAKLSAKRARVKRSGIADES